MIKFKSMTPSTPGNHPKDQERITKFGKVMKKTSLDEIIYPESFIFVMPKKEVSAQLSISLWTFLVSSFALTAASLSNINNYK